MFCGDALAAIRRIGPRESVGEDWRGLDHGTLPEFLRRDIEEGPGRDLGGSISLNARAIQQLLERVEFLEAELASMKA